MSSLLLVLVKILNKFPQRSKIVHLSIIEVYLLVSSSTSLSAENSSRFSRNQTRTPIAWDTAEQIKVKMTLKELKRT